MVAVTCINVHVFSVLSRNYAWRYSGKHFIHFTYDAKRFWFRRTTAECVTQNPCTCGRLCLVLIKWSYHPHHIHICAFLSHKHPCFHPLSPPVSICCFSLPPSFTVLSSFLCWRKSPSQGTGRDGW